MKEDLITKIMQSMLPCLNNAQAEKLKEVLEYSLYGLEIGVTDNTLETSDNTNETLMNAFLSAKRIEGCSEKSLKYYQKTIETMLDGINKSIQQITTDDLRGYLTNYQKEKGSSKVTIDNMIKTTKALF